MKRILSLLLAFVFLQTETWAIGGGPNQGSGGSSSLIGTYAGVLIPIASTAIGVPSSAAIGLFGVSVPATGVATGAAVSFVDGIAFIGNVTGIADPNKKTLTGIVQGTSNFDVISLIPVSVAADGTVTFRELRTKIFAQGNIKAKFQTGIGSVNPLTGTSTGSNRLTGTASLDLFSSLKNDATPDILKTVKFVVDGFQQSSTASSVTIPFTSITTTGTGG